MIVTSYKTKLFLSRILNRPIVKPRSVTITLTSRCNLQCIMCDHWKLKGQEEPSLKLVKNYIDQMKEWGIPEIDVSGGEPFIREDCLEVIKYIDKKGLKINITTNGTLLSKDIIEILSEIRNLRLQISLDGVDAETHDSIRGIKGTFRDVLNTVEETKSKNMQINATTVIMNNNFEQLVDLYSLTKKIGFSSITYQPINDSNLFIGKRKRYNPLRIKKENLHEFDKIIDELINIRKKDAFIGNSVTFLEGINDYFHDKHFIKIKCYSGFLVAIITPTNRFWSCKGDFGDLKTQTIREAWYSKEAKVKRKLIKQCSTPCLYPCYFE